MRIAVDDNGALCLADPAIPVAQDPRGQPFWPAKRVNIRPKLRGGIGLIDRLSAWTGAAHGIDAQGGRWNFQPIFYVQVFHCNNTSISQSDAIQRIYR